MKKVLLAIFLAVLALSWKPAAAAQAANGKAAPAAAPAPAVSLDEQFLEAAQKGDAAAVSQLLDKGAKIDAVSPKGAFTALIATCAMGKVEVVKLLIDKGAKVDAKSSDGTTALSLAMKNNKTEAVQLLRDHGAVQ